MFKKKVLVIALILTILLVPTIVAQDDDEDENGIDYLALLLSSFALGGLILLRYTGMIPDALYNPLLIMAMLGFFYALELLFDAVGFQLNIGGVVISPLAIGFLLIFLVYHSAILQLLSLFRQSL